MTDWLNRGKWDAMQPTEEEVEAVGLRGPLRGVTKIDLKRLARAREAHVEDMGGWFWVRDPKGRNTREGKGDGQHVNLDDPDATRCYCEDFLMAGGAREEEAGESIGRPCKHILAAVLHHPKHADQLKPFIAQLDRNASIAAALKTPVTA